MKFLFPNTLCLAFHNKLPSILKDKKKRSEEINQASETDMAENSELSDLEFKATMVNMLKNLLGKVDNIQE